MRDKRQSLQLLAGQGFAPATIVDVGVLHGTNGLYEVWPDAHVILIEALQRYAPAIEELCAKLKSAEYHIAAAGAAPGALTLAMPPDASVHGITTTERAPADWTRFEVPVVTVDSLLATRGDAPSVVKIDVDGPELDVLKGCTASLARQQDVYVIEAALLDRENARFGQIVEYMRAHEYEVFDIIEPLFRPSDDALWQVDLVFVPRNSQARAQRSYR